MPRHLIRAKVTAASAEAAKPHHSQSGLTKVNLIAQHPYEGFNPTSFSRGKESRMFGVHESVVSNTMAVTHPGTRVSNLRHMVESTVGDAYNLANSGVLQHTTGASHSDSIQRGTGGIGPVKTQPERYGQVPFAGKKY